MKKIRTIVVDDHKLFRKGLILLLEEFENIEVIGEASDGCELLALLKENHPDLIFIDIKMPNLEGDETCKLAFQTYPDLKIIAISMFNDINCFTRMDEAGVNGYLLKNSEPSELKKSIELVMSGKNYYSQELLINLVRQDKPEKFEAVTNLSERELEVLELICEGFSNYEIAEKMFLSHRTIETHRANLLDKTESKNTVQLVTFAIRNKLIKV